VSAAEPAWRLRVTSTVVELVAPAAPLRHQHHEVGAVVFALRLALAELRRDHRVELLPDPARPELAARLVVTGHRDPSPAEEALLWHLGRQCAGCPPADPAAGSPTEVRAALDRHAGAERSRLLWLPAGAAAGRGGPAAGTQDGWSAVLLTDADESADRLAAGQAVQRLLLAAASRHLPARVVTGRSTPPAHLGHAQAVLSFGGPTG
jgi:hypothetical protein